METDVFSLWQNLQQTNADLIITRDNESQARSLKMEHNSALLLGKIFRMETSAAFKMFAHACRNARLEARQHRLRMRVLKKWLQAPLTRCFRAWSENAKSQRALNAKARRVVLRFMNSCLVVTFDRWRDQASEQRRIRTLMKRVADRWTGNSVMSAFAKWIENVEEQKGLNAKARKVVLRFMNSCLVVTFDRWRDQASEQRRIRTLMNRIVLRMKGCSLSRTFGQWVCFVTDMKKEKLEESRRELLATRHVVRAASACLSSCLQGWAQHTFTRRRKRSTVRKISTKATAGSLATSFATWVKLTDTIIRERHQSEVQLQISSLQEQLSLMRVDLASREEQLGGLKLTLDEALRSAALSDAEIARLHREAAMIRAVKEEADVSYQRELAALHEHNSNLSGMWHDEQKLGARLMEQLSQEAQRYKEIHERLTDEEQRIALQTAEVQLLQAQVASTAERNQAISRELEEAHAAIATMHQAICDGGGKLRAFRSNALVGSSSGSPAAQSPRLCEWGCVGLILADPDAEVLALSDADGFEHGTELNVERSVRIAHIFAGSAASRCRPVVCLGDSILRVDSIDVQGRSGKQVRQLLDGGIGSTVKLTNWSEQRQDMYTVTMTRSHLPSIASSGNSPRLYASDLKSRVRDVFDEVLALSEALLQEKDNFEEHKMQSSATREEIKIALASAEEEASGLRATHTSLTHALDVQTEEIAAYKNEIYAVSDECTLLRGKWEDAQNEVLQHSARLLQLHNHIQDVEDRLQETTVSKRKLTVRIVSKVRQASLLRAFLSLKQAVFIRVLLLQTGNKTIDFMNAHLGVRSRIRNSFTALVGVARSVAHAHKSVERAVGPRGLGRLRSEHLLRQRVFAAWKHEADLERYAALETVHTVALQRLLEQNMDEAPERYLDPVLAPRARKALHKSATRDTMTICDRDDGCSSAGNVSGDDSGASSTDDGAPSRRCTSASLVRAHAVTPKHRSTARVLHTQLATAQLARMFQTIVKNREKRSY